MPVTPSSTASAAPPLLPATCGTPQAAASRNTMPKPSCSSPPHLLRHSMVEISAQPYRSGRSSNGVRPKKRTGAPNLLASSFRRFASRPAPAMSISNCGRSRASRATAEIAISKPLRGTRRLTPTMSSAVGDTPKCSRADTRSPALNT